MPVVDVVYQSTKVLIVLWRVSTQVPYARKTPLVALSSVPIESLMPCDNTIVVEAILKIVFFVKTLLRVEPWLEKFIQPWRNGRSVHE